VASSAAVTESAALLDVAEPRYNLLAIRDSAMNPSVAGEPWRHPDTVTAPAQKNFTPLSIMRDIKDDRGPYRFDINW